jgi:hypothetical protein
MSFLSILIPDKDRQMTTMSLYFDTKKEERSKIKTLKSKIHRATSTSKCAATSMDTVPPHTQLGNRDLDRVPVN